MRIRKRRVPLPLISSDPQFNDPKAVAVVPLLHHGHDPHHNLSQQADAISSQLLSSSDHPNQSVGSGSGSGSGGGSSSLDQKYKDCLVFLKEGDNNNNEKDEDEDEDEAKSNDSRKNSILGAEIAAAGVLSQLSSSHHQVVGRRWYEGGGKVFPLKKRIRENDEEDEINTKTKMKTKTKKKNRTMSKKFDGNNEHEDDEQIDDHHQIKGRTNTSSKKRGRGGGGAIMEGSRCSRVNGRGWRCCQQTLVGYSLCEHHLGKGRLRCMNNSVTRGHHRSLGNTDDDANKLTLLLSSSSSTLEESNKMKQELNEVDEDEDEKPLMSTKRRMKLGMIKARSINGLLGQKDNDDIIATD